MQESSKLKLLAFVAVPENGNTLLFFKLRNSPTVQSVRKTFTVPIKQLPARL